MAFLAYLITGCTVLGQSKIEIKDTNILEAKVSGISAGDLNFECICDVSDIQTTTPVFMTIQNKGGEADRLVKVETDQAVKVEFRRGGGKDDLLSAEPVDDVVVPALGTVEFRDGKFAMILTGVIDDIKPGDVVQLTLVFEKYGPIEIDVVASPR